jgi:prepilin-type N-terminal cleavage/methylation domain-containing protein
VLPAAADTAPNDTARAARGAPGFTLMEVMLAVAISSIILGAMITLSVRTLQFKSRGEAEILSVRRATGILALLRRDLEAACGTYRADGNYQSQIVTLLGNHVAAFSPIVAHPFAVRTETSVSDHQPSELRFCSAADHRLAGGEAYRVLFLLYRIEDGNLFRVPWRADLAAPTVNSEAEYLVARGVHMLKVEVLDGAPDLAAAGFFHYAGPPPRLLRVTLELYNDRRVDADGNRKIDHQERRDYLDGIDPTSGLPNPALENGLVEDAEIVEALKDRKLRRFTEIIGLPAGERLP